jgi:glutamine amidotransferase
VTRRSVAVLDYGIGNQASVRRLIIDLGHRCIVTRTHEDLRSADVVVLPGVGAFPGAMESLCRAGLTDVLRERARGGGPLFGICLGMQLLAESSDEILPTAGLGLIPGQIRSIGHSNWHIGWNSIEVVAPDRVFQAVDGDTFYFNHSFEFDAPKEYVTAVARAGGIVTAAVRKGCVAGVQFHPEKSQQAGRRLMARLLADVTEGSL